MPHRDAWLKTQKTTQSRCMPQSTAAKCGPTRAGKQPSHNVGQRHVRSALKLRTACLHDVHMPYTVCLPLATHTSRSLAGYGKRERERDHKLTCSGVAQAGVARASLLRLLAATYHAAAADVRERPHGTKGGGPRAWPHRGASSVSPLLHGTERFASPPPRSRFAGVLERAAA